MNAKYGMDLATPRRRVGCRLSQPARSGFSSQALSNGDHSELAQLWSTTTGAKALAKTGLGLVDKQFECAAKLRVNSNDGWFGFACA